MPFSEARAATRCGGVLSNEYRVPMHGGLLAIVAWFGRRKTLPDKLLRVVQNHWQGLFGEIVALFPSQPETAAESTSLERRKQILAISHVWPSGGLR
jgi:hypothetical protein